MPICLTFVVFPYAQINDAAETIIYMTNRRLVSVARSLALDSEGFGWRRRTQWVAAGKLRLLRVLGGKLISNAVEQLDVALLRVLLHRGDESPGHSARGLSSDRGISPMRYVSRCVPKQIKKAE